MKYRYVIRKDEWENTDDDWQQLLDYARARFSHVIVRYDDIHNDEIVYFNATPEQVRQAANALRIGTTGFGILTTSMLEPSTHEE